MVKNWFWGMCSPRRSESGNMDDSDDDGARRNVDREFGVIVVDDDNADSDDRSKKSSLVGDESNPSGSSKAQSARNESPSGATKDSDDAIIIGDVRKPTDNSLCDSKRGVESGDNEDESLGRTNAISEELSIADLNDDNASLDGAELFDQDPLAPLPKKQFLEAALKAKSNSDLDYIHSAEAPPDQELQNDNESLDGSELFNHDPPAPPPKKQFLEAALTAKSLSDLDYIHSTHSAQAPTDTKCEDDNGSLDGAELFESDPIPPPKKQFLEAALTAKSLSDLDYIHSAEEPVDTKGDGDNGSLDGTELFQSDPIPPPKKQFLEAALTAKSLSDLDYIHSAEELTDTTQTHNDNESLDGAELFEEEPPLVPPKKQFLEAALTAKSLSDLDYFHSVEPLSGSRSHTDTDSLENVQLFEVDSLTPKPKKQFLEAALKAKSLSDLDYFHSAEELTDTTQTHNENESLDGAELFEEEPPVPKKQFLEAALTAKSLSDLDYFHSAEEPTNIQAHNDSDNDSLENIEFLKCESPVPRPKKQFLEAALTAKSLSDLDYFHSAEPPSVSRSHTDADSLDNVQLFELDPLSPRPRKQFLEAALKAKSLSDLDFHFDDRSLGDDELFDRSHGHLPPRKQFLEAALTAKSLSDLKYIHVNATAGSSLKDTESRNDTSTVVPEHLLRLSQPNNPTDIYSIDDDDLFESLSEDLPTNRPLLRAALQAKAQQDEGIAVVSTRDEPNYSTNVLHTEIVPEHLVIANQPALAHAHDNYSIEAEDIFDNSSDDQKPRKPLLKAALEAHAQREEEFSKSLSYLRTDFLDAESSNAYEEFSKSVPDHLAILHQPVSLDELSIDNDRLFDSPRQEGRNPLLLAALRAKEEETKKLQSPFSKSELKMLLEIERERKDIEN